MVNITLGHFSVVLDRRLMDESLRIIQMAFTATGFSGDCTAAPLRKVRMRGQSLLRFSSPTDHHLVVVIKPGNNDTAWEWRVTVPSHSNMSVHEAHKLLKNEEEFQNSVDFHDQLARSDLRSALRELDEVGGTFPQFTNSGNRKQQEPTVATGKPGTDSEDVQTLASKVATARARAKDYNERAESLVQFQKECDDTAQEMLQAEQEISRLQKVYTAAQAKHEKSKKFFESVRNQHAADNKGREASQLLQALDNL